MNRFADLVRPDRAEPATLIHLVDSACYDTWLRQRTQREQTLLAAVQFGARQDDVALLPGDTADSIVVAAGVADRTALDIWSLAKLAETLPAGNYRLVDADPDADAAPGAALIGWMLAQHRFDRFRSRPNDDRGPRILLTGRPGAIALAAAQAMAIATVRDMVNTPAENMGPADIEAAVEKLAESSGGDMMVTRGDALEQGFPMIHAVGRAADRARAPRLIEMRWGDPVHPAIAIIGKGVTFDSGGLDIKPSAGMRLMKKDMGGAAHAIALTQLVIAARLPVRVHLIIPVAENAIAGNAFRPGDVLISRKGKTVEIGNTDAEGRLILADALTRACEESPEFIVDFATLTGAARVALGPDLPATFGNRADRLAALVARGNAIGDPLWAMPLWQPYLDMLKSDIADIANAGEGGLAGAVTAALFLEQFVEPGTEWIHVDTFAWRPAAKPGRPKGGEALGLRALFEEIKARYAAT